jgi:hypothetical protein
MTSEEINIKLHSKKSADRRQAAKKIGKTRDIHFVDALYRQYIKERNDARTWETQCEMIKALGILDNKNAIAEIEQIVYQNIPHDMITFVATTTRSQCI